MALRIESGMQSGIESTKQSRIALAIRYPIRHPTPLVPLFPSSLVPTVVLLRLLVTVAGAGATSRDFVAKFHGIKVAR